MELTRYADAAAFLAAAGTFLEAHEAEHCLTLGIAQTLVQRTTPPREQPYLAAVTADGHVVATLVQTPPYNPVVSLTDAPEAITLFVEDLLARGEKLPGISGPKALSRAFAEQWQAATGRNFRLQFAERIFRLEQVIPPSAVPGQMRRATVTDRAILGKWLLAFDYEAFEESARASDEEMNHSIDRYFTEPGTGMYLWEDGGEPVAMTAHTGPTPHGMRIGPVYTPPEQRGHGYASALVAALSQMLLDQGRQFCFLFTDLANPTSNHIYQTIGYEPVMDVDVFVFDKS